MKLKYTFVTNEVADKIVAVAVGDDLEKFNGFIKMNEVAADIFGFLKEEITEDEVVAGMCKKYPNEDESEVRNTVKEFTAKLMEAGVLQ